MNRALKKRFFKAQSHDGLNQTHADARVPQRIRLETKGTTLAVARSKGRNLGF